MRITTTASGVTVEPVVDGYTVSRPGSILIPPPGTAADWQANGKWFGPGRWHLPLGGFLLRTGDRLVLVDVGLGPPLPAHPGDSGALPGALRASGVRPEEITDVVLTHLHADHVGWVSTDGVPTFANAAHHWHADDWDYVRARHDTSSGAWGGVAETLRPATDLLRPVRGERTEVLPDVFLRSMPGHTPGNCVIEIGPPEDRLMLLGDTAHHPVTLTENGWEDKFDVDRARARQVRAKLSLELERTGARAVGAHFDGGRFGRVVRGRDGQLRWQPGE